MFPANLKTQLTANMTLAYEQNYDFFTKFDKYNFETIKRAKKWNLAMHL